MPKEYITKKATDVIHLRNFYRILIKLLCIFYMIMAVFIVKIFIYNFYLTKNDYFVVTTFGKLIGIDPQSKANQ